MKIADPLALKFSQPKEIVIFAASQLQGERKTQEDFFMNFNDECFVIADGVGGMQHGSVASKLAAENAIWGYKLIRQRPFYWQDKKLFLQRIFRSTNIALWQKKRETGFEAGLATTLEVLVVGGKNFWLGHAGDSSTWLLEGIANAKLVKLTTDDVDKQGNLTKVIGVERYGMAPQFVGKRFAAGDIVLLVTDGITKVLSPDQMQNIIQKAGDTAESLSSVVLKLLESAESAGSTDNMTAILVKRVSHRT